MPHVSVPYYLGQNCPACLGAEQEVHGESRGNGTLGRPIRSALVRITISPCAIQPVCKLSFIVDYLSSDDKQRSGGGGKAVVVVEEEVAHITRDEDEG